MTETKPTQPTADSSQDDQPFGKPDKRERLTRSKIEAILGSLDGMKQVMRTLGEELAFRATTDRETDAVYYLKKANFEMSESFLKEAYYDAPSEG